MGANPNDFVIENGVLIKYVGAGGDVVIPNGVTEIGKRVFKKREDLCCVTIPHGVKSIGTMAFDECSALETVVFPDTLIDIGASAFHKCKSLTSISLPQSLERIGDRAFRSCYSLVHISIPDGLKKIGKGSFMACKSLGEITIPQGVKTIPDFAFSDTDVCGQTFYHACVCPLMTIHGTPKLSQLAFGSSQSRSKQHAPPMWFRDMDLMSIPAQYRSAAVNGFMKVYSMNSDAVEMRKSEYVKYIKSQRRKYYDVVINDDEKLRLFLVEGIIPKTEISEILELGADVLTTEMRALLLEYSQ